MFLLSADGCGAPVKALLNLEDLDAELSRPTEGALDVLRTIPGDVMVLGAGGKMGPTLCRMLRRGLDDLGQKDRRVFAVSRFASGLSISDFKRQEIDAIACDLLNREAVERLPDAPNVIYMAGQKFGTSDAPERTWAMNTIMPGIVAERYADSRIVAFSTGCVYPLVPVDGPGANEESPLTPPGEYANSCVGRERVFQFYAKEHGTPLLLLRLCYAIDLRYGVLSDIATKVARGEPVDVSMGYVHIIWQRDANTRAIQCLARAGSPPVALNVTGLARVSVRELAERFGAALGRKAVIAGRERSTAWLWDAQRSYDWFGEPETNLDEMIEATARWVSLGGPNLGKPTHFEVTDGSF